MDTIKLNILSVIGSKFCVEAEDGEKIYDLIYKAFKENKKIELSFLNIELLTTAFLNSAVGKLYKDFNEDEIKKKLSVSDISKSGAVSLKRVVDNAKLFYKNPEALQDSINNILDDYTDTL